jgi:hypothetical protein
MEKIKMNIPGGQCRALSSVSAVLFVLLCTSAAATGLLTGNGSNAVLHLGRIDVHGEQAIIRELQAIKMGLRQHFSNDPTVADVVVCTLENQAGSHIMQRLSCATNRGWAQQRNGIQASMTYAQQSTNVKEGLPHQRLGSEDVTACSTSSCYQQVISPMDETLGLLPAHYLQVTVDGSVLQALLRKIPDPTPLPPAFSTTTTGYRH